MKKINMYVRGVCRNTGNYKEIKDGFYGVILEYKGVEKVITGNGFNTTQSRMILTGILHGLSLLKEPCYITIHTTISVGLNKKNVVNIDLISKVINKIDKEGHNIELKVNSDHQEKLINALRNQIKLKKLIVIEDNKIDLM